MPPAENVGHLPVLPAEVLQWLNPEPGQIALDGTLGRGGHALLIAERLGADGTLVGLDVDPENVAFASVRLADAPCSVHCLHGNFADARSHLRKLKHDGKLEHHSSSDLKTDPPNDPTPDGDDVNEPGVDLLLADLGFASNQMDNPARGFSFSSDGPLDMRLNPAVGVSAESLVNTLPEQALANLIYELGEDRLSRKIASKIVAARQQSPICTTSELSRLVREAYGPRAGRSPIDPATRTFMALRIAVNSELDALDRLLADVPYLLRPGGRAAVISFHSLEDRRVKQAFVQLERDGVGRRLTRKPLVAGEQERRANPRSRSAKLRVFERSSETVG